MGDGKGGGEGYEVRGKTFLLVSLASGPASLAHTVAIAAETSMNNRRWLAEEPVRH